MGRHALHLGHELNSSAPYKRRSPDEHKPSLLVRSGCYHGCSANPPATSYRGEISRRTFGSTPSGGLIPFWMQEKPKVPHINARAETVHNLPLFWEAFAKRRCLRQRSDVTTVSSHMAFDAKTWSRSL